MNFNSKIYVAGHNGLVGSSILKNLKSNGYLNVLTADRSELNLEKESEVDLFFKKNNIEYVIIAAAKVGGIQANNKYRADFLLKNLKIQNNLIGASHNYNIKKLLFLGSSCIYPKNSLQPIKENYLLTNELEYTNEPYAIAKIAGIKLCESYNIQYNTNFISVMPSNLYGYNDNFDLYNSHVIPALIRKVLLSKLIMQDKWDLIKSDLTNNPIENLSSFSKKSIINKLNEFGIITKNNFVELKLLGTGKPKREFLWSQDLADASLYVMKNLNFEDLFYKDQEIKNTHINIGSGKEISIFELSNKIKKIIEFKGDIVFDNNKFYDGTLRKLMDSSKINNLGWNPKVDIDEGLNKLYEYYLNTLN